MRLSELLWAQGELRADDPAPGLDEPQADRGLAGRLARLPAAHPSARPDAGLPDAVWPTAGGRTAAPDTASWADRQPGGDRASEDAWWRGESDIWWRAPDRSAGEADYDEIGDSGDPGELADAEDATDKCGLDDTGSPDDTGGADEADATDEADGQRGGTGRRLARAAGRAPGAAGRGHGLRDGHWGEASGPRAKRDHGSYRPWFSPAVSGDPWFAEGPEYPAGG